MKKILKLSPVLSIFLTPLYITSCSNTNHQNNESKGIWNFADSNENVIFLKTNKLPKNLEDIEIRTSNNELINFDIEKSKITKNNEHFLVLNEEINSDVYVYNLNDKNNKIKISSDETKTFKPYDLLEDQKYFFDLVREMSRNKIPTLIWAWNASLVIQQAFYISLVNYFQNNNFDETYLVARSDVFEQNRFDTSILIENNIWNGNKNIENNTKEKFNLFQVDYDEWDGAKNNINIINKIKSKFAIDTKFDFVITDWEFTNHLVDKNINWFKFIIQNANRIVVLSDGGAHTNRVVSQLVNLLQNHIPSNREKVIEKIKNLQNGISDDITYQDILDFVLLSNYDYINGENSKFNYISFNNYDSNIYASSTLNDNVIPHDSAFSTNFLDYAKLIDDPNNRNKFSNIFSKLFISSDLKIENIIINGLDEFDRNKKNAIFLGSSLFKPLSGNVSESNFSRLQKLPKLRKIVQETMNELLKKFPQDQYNIIFKLHPAFSDHEGSINYVKLITNNQIAKPIVMNSNIPLETFVANEYYLFDQSPTSINSYKPILFNSDKNTRPEEWTTYFGMQATSTTIQTTRLFYQTVFDIDIDRVAELIPFSNFPIPTYFSIVNGLTTDKQIRNFYDENKQIIEKKNYYWFCPSLAFNDPKLERYDSIKLNF